MVTKLNHPMADEISIIDHAGAYAGRGSKEIAFFSNGEWVTDIMGEFEPYAEPEAGDTRVYRYIPKAVLANFLDLHAVARIR